MQHASRWVLIVLVGGGAVKGLQVRATPHPPSPPRSKCLADRRRAVSALCRTQLMKCLTRPQICPAAALQVLEQLASPGPCIAHHLVRPWCSGVPREAQFTCKCSRGTGSPPSGFCTFFFCCQSAVQPGTSCHMTWRGMEAGLYQEGQESRLFPFVDLNGGVLNF